MGLEVMGIVRAGIPREGGTCCEFVFEAEWKVDGLEWWTNWEPEWLHCVSSAPSFTRKANLS